MFFWRETVAGLDWGFTDRHGGVSTGVAATLNLAAHVGDDGNDVAANRALVASALDVPADRLVFPDQCHGAEVAVVDRPVAGPLPRVDALVTRRVDLVIGVLVADCVPVLLADLQAGVVAAVHAGRRGLTAGIVDRAVDAMTALGATDIRGVLGPSVCGRCYEVPAVLRDEVAAAHPVCAAVSWQGTPALDIASGAAERLSARGVAVRWLAGCTLEEAALYSYRREHVTGRFAGFVTLRDRAS